MILSFQNVDGCDPDWVQWRKGMFNAVLGWVLKLAASGSIFHSGFAFELTGWVTDLGAAQTEETYQTMRNFFAAGPIVFALLATYFIAGAKVTETDVTDSHRKIGIGPS